MTGGEKVLFKSSWDLWMFKYCHDDQRYSSSEDVGPEESDEDVLVREMIRVISNKCYIYS